MRRYGSKTLSTKPRHGALLCQKRYTSPIMSLAAHATADNRETDINAGVGQRGLAEAGAEFLRGSKSLVFLQNLPSPVPDE